MTLDTRPLGYRDDAARLSGVVVTDVTRHGKRPGVLVFHGGAGLDDHARGRARLFAEAGFVALACDMYGEGVAGRDAIMRQVLALRDDRELVRRRAGRALEALSKHAEVDGRIAAVGYCLGGMVALELARGGAALAATVSVHGTLETPRPAAPGAVRGPILVCHGALDPHVPMAQVAAFVDEMTHAGADCQVIVYGTAMHGFTHETATGQQPGVRYDETTDRRSRIAIDRFLREAFGEPLPSSIGGGD
jgi:dienelactone hydrolase